MEVPTPRVMDNKRRHLTHAVKESTYNLSYVERRWAHGPYGPLTGVSVNLIDGTLRAAKACGHCGKQTYAGTEAADPLTVLRSLDPVPCHTCGRRCTTSDPAQKIGRAYNHAELANQASAEPNSKENA